MLPKLVRDKIPEIIETNRKTCEYHIATHDEYKRLLYDKMREELQEFVDTPTVEEAGDMYEVFLSILRFHEIDICDVIFSASSKKEDRGGFLGRVVLESVVEPGG